MRITLASVTTEQLRAADSIVAVDPNRPAYSQELHYVATCCWFHPFDARLFDPLEVEIDSSQGDQLQELLCQVEAATGSLDPDVQALKK